MSPPDSPPPKTIAEASDTVSSCTASLSSPGISDVQRHVTESRAVVKVHAVSDGEWMLIVHQKSDGVISKKSNSTYCTALSESHSIGFL